ncbi:hypothetical protein GCM10010965_13980 [Caldalkalibacillus thermarum]|nr:hypothetical protein GCM10010965_13980 [Caldalkalibacillus thermarum]
MFIVLSLLVWCFVVNSFVQNAALEYVTGLLALLALVMAFRQAERLFQVSSVIFCAAGSGLFLSNGGTWHELPLLLTSFAVILVLFYVLPFINSMIITGRYDQSVSKLLKAHVQHFGQLYGRGLSASFLLGSFLNIAMLPLVYGVLTKHLRSLPERLAHLFISSSMLRGYALCLAWSPMEVLVAITVDITGTGYLTFLPWLLLIALTLLVIDGGLGYLRFRAWRIHDHMEQTREKLDWSVYRRIGLLMCYLALFIVCVTVVKQLFQLNFLLSVSLVIVPFSFVWAFMIGRLRTFFIYSLKQWRERVSTLHSYVLLFLSMGLFIGALRDSQWIDYLQAPFIFLAGQPIFLFVTIQVMFLGLALVGFHPLVTMGLVGELVQPLLMWMNPVSIGLVLITSSLATVMAGPFNVSVILTGNLLKENPYKIMVWNLTFAFLFGGTGSIVAWALL